MIPEPVLFVHDGIHVLRDDLCPGGTKRRFAEKFFRESEHKEFAYPGTAFGAAIVALAYAAVASNKKVNIFIAERKSPTEFIKECLEVGGDLIKFHSVKMGFYKNVIAACERFCNREKVFYLPCGLRMDYAIDEIKELAIGIKDKHGQFDYCISACSSGTLQEALQKSEIAKKYIAVGTGMADPIHGKAELIKHYELQKFEQDSKILPPFPTVPNYDGKVWQYVIRLKENDPESKILFWNVAATKKDKMRKI